MLVQGPSQYTPEKIEELARRQGMVYRREVLDFEQANTESN